MRTPTIRPRTGRTATCPNLKNQPHPTDAPHVRRHLLALVITLGALTTACGGANDQDRQARERFRTDPLFETSPPGAEQTRDVLNPGSPTRGEAFPGEGVSRSMGWRSVSLDIGDTIAWYVETLTDQGWHAITVDCRTLARTEDRDKFILTARRRIDAGVVDSARITVQHDENQSVKTTLNLSIPFHDTDPFPEPDPDVPPDTSCVADALAD